MLLWTPGFQEHRNVRKPFC